MNVNSKYHQKMIFFGMLSVVTGINAFVLPNIIKLKKMDSVFLTIILVLCSIASLVHILVLKEGFDLINYSFIKRKIDFISSDDYSFIKSEIDKLGFESPSQMAGYFYSEFGSAPSFKCALRMTVFAYNYFNIEKLEKRDSSFGFVVIWFNNGFKNASKLKTLADIPSALDIEKYITSYNDIKWLIYELFEDSKLRNEYFDLFDKKYKTQKYKL